MSMTIGKRITIGFASVVVVTLAFSAFVWTRLHSVNQSVEALVVDSIPGLGSSGQIMDHSREQEFLTLHALAATTPEYRAKEIKALQENETHVAKLYAEYEATIHVDVDRKNFDELKVRYDAWVSARNKLLNLQAKPEALVATFEAEAQPVFDRYIAQLDTLIDWNSTSAQENAITAEGTVATAQMGLYVGGSIVSILAAITGVYIVWSTRKALSAISQVLSNNSAQVACASGQVSASSQSLAQGASEQAASLEESSSALEEMASMIKKNADTSAQAASYSDEAKGSADRGTEAMDKMNGAIADIERSAMETAKIIKTIDEIAFQTNLLALNAAVEAARAGEAGKGFAVVAEEVRNLAMRSADAAKNTSTLIEESVGKAKNGVTIAQSVAVNLKQINDSTAKVTGLIAEIAAASKEQATGIDQISQAVGQMDKVTQTNAANAEETAAASEELSAQAEQLRSCVNTLQALVGVTGDSTNRPAAPVPQRSFDRMPAAPQKKSPKLAEAPRPQAASARDLIPLESAQQVGNDFSDFSKAA